MAIPLSVETGMHFERREWSTADINIIFWL